MLRLFDDDANTASMLGMVSNIVQAALNVGDLFLYNTISTICRWACCLLFPLEAQLRICMHAASALAGVVGGGWWEHQPDICVNGGFLNKVCNTVLK